MDDRNNTIAGWVLGAGIVALGAWLVTGEAFKGDSHAKGGWELADAEASAGGGEAAQPVEFYLAQADVAKGAEVFKKCVACHTIEQGGANGLGPNLYGVMGEPVGTGHGGYAFSSALASHGGTWDWETMSAWLKSPRTFANGTKMTFAGLSDPQDRADVMLYLNQQGGSLTVPPPPAEGAAPAGNEAAPAGNEVTASDAPAENAHGQLETAEERGSFSVEHVSALTEQAELEALDGVGRLDGCRSLLSSFEDDEAVNDPSLLGKAREVGKLPRSRKVPCPANVKTPDAGRLSVGVPRRGVGAEGGALHGGRP